MFTLNIELSPTTETFVLQQATVGGFSSPVEYVLQLIEDEQKRKEREAIEAKLLEAIESPSVPWMQEKLHDLVGRVRERHPSAHE